MRQCKYRKPVCANMASNRVVPNHSLNLDHNGKTEIHVHVLEQHSRLTNEFSSVSTDFIVPKRIK